MRIGFADEPFRITILGYTRREEEVERARNILGGFDRKCDKRILAVAIAGQFLKR